uniref:Sulfate_transp domain-containing protein n=1 Tax=Angiostrongylus cantonensis TaxID=6313 RepID=A0A0K0D5X4_ANGCA
LEWLVLQAPVVRALIIVSDIIALAEMREAAESYVSAVYATFLRNSDLFSVGSLSLAIFGVHTLARVTSVRSQAQFSCLQGPVGRRRKKYSECSENHSN